MTSNSYMEVVRMVTDRCDFANYFLKQCAIYITTANMIFLSCIGNIAVYVISKLINYVSICVKFQILTLRTTYHMSKCTQTHAETQKSTTQPKPCLVDLQPFMTSLLISLCTTHTLLFSSFHSP